MYNPASYIEFSGTQERLMDFYLNCEVYIRHEVSIDNETVIYTITGSFSEIFNCV